VKGETYGDCGHGEEDEGDYCNGAHRSAIPLHDPISVLGDDVE
jgi:hypothetical protein